MRFIKVLLLSLVLLVFATPSFQYGLKIFNETPLKGFYHKYPPPSLDSLTPSGWFSSRFQDAFTQHLNDHTGLRNTLIRISNQADYSLFGIIHAEGFIRGKQGYLYEEDYIHEYTGEYFIGQAAIDKKLLRLKDVIDSLRARHVTLLLVYEPGKASFYPEHIPLRFHPEKRSLTNYEYMTRRSAELGIGFLDMNRYFLLMKDTARFPLFPKYGMHWSLFGVPYAVDTLARAIEHETGVALPRFSSGRYIRSGIPMGSDNDIGELLNVVCPLHPTQGGFPQVTFAKSPPAPLKVLAIADSYYLNIITAYGRKMFASQDYWYYNKKVFPYQNNNPPLYVDKSNLREKLENYNLVLLMISEINLHCGFWNFADEAYAAFHPGLREPLVWGIENDIRNDREWFRFMVRKARIQHRPLEEMIREDAWYTFYTNFNELKGKSYWDSVYHITFDIKNNAEWYAQVVKKAADRKIPVDSMLLLDAVYCYGQSKNKH